MRHHIGSQSRGSVAGAKEETNRLQRSGALVSILLLGGTGSGRTGLVGRDIGVVGLFVGHRDGSGLLLNELDMVLVRKLVATRLVRDPLFRRG